MRTLERSKQNNSALVTTPTVADVFTGNLKSSQQKDHTKHSVNLSQALTHPMYLLSTPTASDATSASVIGKKDKFYRLPSGRMRKINGNGVDGSIGLAREIALTSSQEASLASLLARPDNDEERKMTAFSGRRCLELFRSSGPLGSLARTLLGSLAWHSSMVLLKWQVKPIYSEIEQSGTQNLDEESSSELLENLSKSATPSKHLLFQLAPSARPTEETECGLLPTHRAGNPGSRPNGKGGKVLAEEIKKIGMLTTPQASDLGRKTKYKQGGTALSAQIGMLRTPDANMDRGKRSKENMKSRLDRNMPLNLNDQLSAMGQGLIATPNARDHKSGKRKTEHDYSVLSEQIANVGLIDTPTATMYKGAGANQTVRNCLDYTIEKPDGKKTGLKLQPAFVEWMMGYPEKWTELPCPKQDTASSD